MHAYVILVGMRNTRGDAKCTIRAGICKKDSLMCSGQYWSGFCAGDKHRRCCIPGNKTRGMAYTHAQIHAHMHVHARAHIGNE